MTTDGIVTAARRGMAIAAQISATGHHNLTPVGLVALWERLQGPPNVRRLSRPLYDALWRHFNGREAL